MRLNSYHRAYTYKVTTPPESPAVSVNDLKAHLNITHNLQDNLLQLYLSAAIKYAEDYTNITLMETEFTTYRDNFPSLSYSEGYYAGGINPLNSTPSSSGSFELRKSPLVDVSEISYINTQGVSTIVDPSKYYLTRESDYSEVLATPNSDWPTDLRNTMQSVTIVFTAGVTNDSDEVPADWKLAIMQHASSLWSDRGDCTDGSCGGGVPSAAKSFYSQQKIMSL